MRKILLSLSLCGLLAACNNPPVPAPPSFQKEEQSFRTHNGQKIALLKSAYMQDLLLDTDRHTTLRKIDKRCENRRAQNIWAESRNESLHRFNVEHPHSQVPYEFFYFGISTTALCDAVEEVKRQQALNL